MIVGGTLFLVTRCASALTQQISCKLREDIRRKGETRPGRMFRGSFSAPIRQVLCHVLLLKSPALVGNMHLYHILRTQCRVRSARPCMCVHVWLRKVTCVFQILHVLTVSGCIFMEDCACHTPVTIRILFPFYFVLCEMSASRNAQLWETCFITVM